MKIRPFTRVSVLLFIALLCPRALLAEDIPLIKKGGVYEVPVEINGVLTLHFVLDSGASEVLNPADVILTLVRTGTIKDTDFLPGKTYTLADGSELRSPRFILRSLKVESHQIRDVPASIGTLTSNLLLRQSLLERLGTWGIDSQRKMLVLGTLPSSAGQPYPPQKRSEKEKRRLSEDQRVAVGSDPPIQEVQTQPPNTLRNSIDMEFVLIPAGEFQMGSNDGDGDEKPVHTVRISQPFYLGKYEVTQDQWQAVMGSNPSRFRGDPRLPVESVSWDDVQAFISKLTAQEGGDVRYRLPTEAEWEYAARAGSTTAYSFGDDPRLLGEHAWYYENSGYKMHPVGQRKSNVWGLYDMHGNVWEWVQNLYGPYTTAAVFPSFLRGLYVYRGGSWNSGIGGCRSAYRGRKMPDNRDDRQGFRILRTVP